MRALAIVASLVLAAGVLTGCAADPVDIESTAASDLQAAVIAVAEPAAGGDYSASMERLDDVQALLDAAIADQSVSAARAASIQSAIDAVRADLEVALTPEPEPTPVEPEKPGKGNKPEKPGKDR